MQEREQRGVEYDERNKQRTTAGRRRLFLARKERHGAMNGHRQRTWAQPRHGFHVRGPADAVDWQGRTERRARTA